MEPGLPAELAKYVPDVLRTSEASVMQALVALPLATALGAMLAFRPRRRGTPARLASVIQTQIILSVVGAVVMLIVGASLARAFGIVGAANLIRYRAKIDDPKDAVVMLATLTVGLACGVGVYGLAIFGTLFVLGVLWLIESLEPEGHKVFDLKVVSGDPASLRPQIELVLRRYHIDYELRSAGPKELCYATELPWTTRTDRVSNAILMLDSSGDTEVMWEDKKKK